MADYKTCNTINELLELLNKNAAGNSWIKVKADVFLYTAQYEQQAFCQALASNTTLRRLDLTDNVISAAFLNNIIEAVVKNTTLTDLKFNQQGHDPAVLNNLHEAISTNRLLASQKVFEAPLIDTEKTAVTDDTLYCDSFNSACKQIEQGNTHNLYRLLSSCPQLVLRTTTMDEDLLQIAVNYCQIECVQMLLSFGKQFKSYQSYVNSALIYAVNNDDLFLTQILLKNGADVNAQQNGFTPMHWVRSLGLARFLVAQGADLFHIINSGVSKTNYGNTVLHSVLWHKQVPQDLLEYLLDRGIAVNAQNFHGETALHLLLGEWAQLDFLSQTINLLIKSGANPLIEDGQRCNPLDLAHKLRLYVPLWKTVIDDYSNTRNLPQGVRTYGFFDKVTDVAKPIAVSTESLDHYAIAKK